MPKIPIVKARALATVAKKRGYIHETTHGSHMIFRHPGTGKHLSIPQHAGKDLGKGLTRSLIKSMGISPDEFVRLLKT